MTDGQPRPSRDHPNRQPIDQQQADIGAPTEPRALIRAKTSVWAPARTFTTLEAKGPITWPFMLSGRRDLNPRPLDPQLHHNRVNGDRWVLRSPPTCLHSCCSMPLPTRPVPQCPTEFDLRRYHARYHGRSSHADAIRSTKGGSAAVGSDNKPADHYREHQELVAAAHDQHLTDSPAILYKRLSDRFDLPLHLPGRDGDRSVKPHEGRPRRHIDLGAHDCIEDLIPVRPSASHHHLL